MRAAVRASTISAYAGSGAGLVPIARADDGTIEAAGLPSAPGWFLGVQWHPEDTVDTDPAQLRVFAALVAAARCSVRSTRLTNVRNDRASGPFAPYRDRWSPTPPRR